MFTACQSSPCSWQDGRLCPQPWAAKNGMRAILTPQRSWRFWSWSCPVLSFGINFSVSSFHLPLCVYFDVLRKATMSSALRISDFMKNRSWSALQYSVVFTRNWHFKRVSCVLLMPFCCVWVTFPFSAVVYADHLPIGGLCFFFVVFTETQADQF